MIWTPEPSCTQSSVASLGDLKTSPLTIFHPLSSTSSLPPAKPKKSQHLRVLSRPLSYKSYMKHAARHPGMNDRRKSFHEACRYSHPRCICRTPVTSKSVHHLAPHLSEYRLRQMHPGVHRILTWTSLWVEVRACLAEQALVAGEVAADGAHHDHGHDAGHDNDHHERIEDGEPVDAAARHAQVCIPTRCPIDVAQLPIHVIRVHQLCICKSSTISLMSVCPCRPCLTGNESTSSNARLFNDLIRCSDTRWQGNGTQSSQLVTQLPSLHAETHDSQAKAVM